MSGSENIPRCPCVAMHLIESSHDLLSSGYVYDSVPPGRAVMEHDITSPPLFAWGLFMYLYCLVKHVGVFYEFDQFVDAFWCAHESAPLSMSTMSEGVTVSLVDFAILGDVLAGLEHGPAGASNVFGQDKALIVFSGVCVSSLALY